MTRRLSILDALDTAVDGGGGEGGVGGRIVGDSEILGASSRLEEKRSEIRPSCATSVEDVVSINLLHLMEVLNAMKFLNLL
ncbi:hypothetical protein L6452_07352 [Arctium lappa]|uniref:Uncharacterized protein n=1 Tax=Arctium lappa TaxID=4217 RepID=A0ACB9EK99_ARCLA|nr:hypothetical protein L6452_07352 [Arctium lappa]